MRGKKTPTDIRAKAVGVALVVGGAEAGRQLGIPERTVQQWVASPEFAELRATPREDVAATMWVAAQEAVHELRKGITNPKTYLRDKVAAFDSLIEKRALLIGEPTARTETRSLTDGYNDDEKRRLRDFIDSLVTEPGTAAGDPLGAGAEVRQ